MSESKVTLFSRARDEAIAAEQRATALITTLTDAVGTLGRDTWKGTPFAGMSGRHMRRVELTPLNRTRGGLRLVFDVFSR
jgi:hypothetical protein